MPPKLFIGYLPLRIRAIESAVRDVAATEADVIRIRADASLAQIRQIQLDAQRQPTDKRSTHIAVVIDTTRMPERVQNALLKLVEEPPPAISLILTAAEQYHVIPTLQSRCTVTLFRPPNQGQLIRELNDSGLALPAAVRAATQVTLGHSVEIAPDEQSFVKARNFLDAASAKRFDLAMRTAQEFQIRDLVALREKLLETNKIAALVATYRFALPSAAAIATLFSL